MVYFIISHCSIFYVVSLHSLLWYDPFFNCCVDIFPVHLRIFTWHFRPTFWQFYHLWHFQVICGDSFDIFWSWPSQHLTQSFVKIHFAKAKYLQNLQIMNWVHWSMALLKQSLFYRNTIFLGKNVNFQEKCKFFSGHFENLFKKGKRYKVTTSYKRSSKVSVQCYKSLTDDIISLFNFIFTDLHGYQIKPGLLGNVKIG